jgi:hypothetical protein
MRVIDLADSEELDSHDACIPHFTVLNDLQKVLEEAVHFVSKQPGTQVLLTITNPTP